MTRREGAPTFGNRYIGNLNIMEVHDLDNEKTAANQCQIDEIIASENVVIFEPDTLDQARREGYDNCHHCIGRSLR